MRQIGKYLAFYNAQRPHLVHTGRTPDQVYFSSLPVVSTPPATPDASNSALYRR
ncbi:MAG: hypothetical protein ACTHLA_13515 [Asticcacaulis sp.]|uniref:hypothetical protein n=1 Tax=Asticcacaulis sp. TaxID=1872648 RepID=UPI003F7BF325